MSKSKKALLVAGKENILSGKILIEMGERVDSNRLLIATTLKYSVFIRPPHLGGWLITQYTQPIKSKKL